MLRHIINRRKMSARKKIIEEKANYLESMQRLS